jgi:hypothetical protein
MARDLMFTRDMPNPIPNLEKVSAPGMHLRDGETMSPSLCVPGTLFIQDMIEKDGKMGFFDNIIGGGWALIANDTANLSATMTLATREALLTSLGAVWCISLLKVGVKTCQEGTRNGSGTARQKLWL